MIAGCKPWPGCKRRDSGVCACQDCPGRVSVALLSLLLQVARYPVSYGAVPSDLSSLLRFP